MGKIRKPNYGLKALFMRWWYGDTRGAWEINDGLRRQIDGLNKRIKRLQEQVWSYDNDLDAHRRKVQRQKAKLKAAGELIAKLKAELKVCREPHNQADSMPNNT